MKKKFAAFVLCVICLLSAAGGVVVSSFVWPQPATDSRQITQSTKAANFFFIQYLLKLLS